MCYCCFTVNCGTAASKSSNDGFMLADLIPFQPCGRKLAGKMILSHDIRQCCVDIQTVLDSDSCTSVYIDMGGQLGLLFRQSEN